MSSKEFAIKIIVSNQKIRNLAQQLIDLRKYTREIEFLLRNEISVNDQFKNMLTTELICEEAYSHANKNSL